MKNFSYRRFHTVGITYFATRPDTRPIPVADGWAGAKMRVFPLFDSITMTDGPTDRRTDKASYRVASPRLKIITREDVSNIVGVKRKIIHDILS